jgi:hypothetical protein
VGIWAGSTAAFVGFLPILVAVVPFVVGHSFHLGPRPTAHPGIMFIPMLALFLAPIGLFFGIPGLLVLAVSIPIYIDAKRKETQADLTSRSS